jgi:hypothetical protein
MTEGDIERRRERHGEKRKKAGPTTLQECKGGKASW